MTDGNAPTPEPTLFSAILTPHRSLTGIGFLVLMVCVGLISFVAGVMFLMMGAWPVFGFFGIDVLLIYWAFRANYRAALAYEQILVTPSELRIRKVSQRGEASEYMVNPVWVTLDREVHPEFGIEALYLVSRGRKLPIAAFLGPREKESFATALSAALGEAKRGPTRTA